MTAEATHDLLLACLRRSPDPSLSERLAGLSDGVWNDLLTLAGEQRLQPLLLHRIQELRLAELVPSVPLNRLKQRSLRTTRRNLALYGDLRRLAADFQTAGIPLLALKGIYLAAAVYPSVAVREMGDIDLLIPEAGLGRGIELMRAAGYETRKPLQALSVHLASGHHLPPFIKPPRSMVEIHWQIANPHDPVEVDIEGWWARAAPVDLMGAAVLAPAPEDLLLHLCLHASYQHQFAFGLRPLVDIPFVIDRFGDRIDWERFCRRVDEAGGRRGCYLTLRLAAELLDAAVPSSVLAALAPEARVEEALTAAGRHVFTELNEARLLSENVALIGAQPDGAGRLKHLFRTVFPPQRQMAIQYPAAPNSPRMIWFYIYRIWDLLRRHGGRLVRLWRGEQEVGELAERKRVLRGWLGE